MDISPSGMFIETNRPAARGVLVRFECVSTEPQGVVRGTARVMWLRPHSDAQGRAGMGVRFVRLEPGSTRVIEDLIAYAAPNPEARLASDGPEGRTQSEEPSVVLTAERTIGPTNRSSSVPPKGLRAATLRGMRPADVRSDSRSSNPPPAARQESRQVSQQASQPAQHQAPRSDPPSYRSPSSVPDARNNAGSQALRERLAASRPPPGPSSAPSSAHSPLAQAAAAAAQAAASASARPAAAYEPQVSSSPAAASTPYESGRATTPDGSSPVPSSAAGPSTTSTQSSVSKSLGATVHNLAPPPARLSSPGYSSVRRGSDHALGVPSPPPPPWKARQSERPPEPGGVEVIRSVTVSADMRTADARAADARPHEGRSAANETQIGQPEVRTASRAERSERSERTDRSERAGRPAQPATPHIPNNLPGSEDANRPEWEPIIEPARPAIRPDRPPLELSTPYLLPSRPSEASSKRFRNWPAVIVVGSGALVALVLTTMFGAGPAGLPDRGSGVAPESLPALAPEAAFMAPKAVEDPAARAPKQVILIARIDPPGASVSVQGQTLTSPGQMILPIASVTWPLIVRAEMPGYGATELKLPERVFERADDALTYELLLSLQVTGATAPAGAPPASTSASVAPVPASATAPTPSAAPTPSSEPSRSERKSSRSARSARSGEAPASTAAAPTPSTTAPTVAAAAAPTIAPSPEPLMSAAPPPATPAAEATANAASPLERALQCLSKGDNGCVISALEGASGTRELDLLIETYRATGNSAAAEKSMKRSLDLYPSGRRAPQYRRTLGIPEPNSAP